MSIVEFILARIAEDEELAAAAANAMPPVAALPHLVDDDPLALFVGRWNPWRVMALCVLQRQDVLTHRPIADGLGGWFCSTCDDRRGKPGWPCRPLKLLANGWGDHPHFRPEWTPQRRRTLIAL